MGDQSERIWSVLVQGLAIEDRENVPTSHVPHPEVVDPGERVVRIRADVVTGRRFPGFSGSCWRLAVALCIVAGTANPELAEAVAARVGSVAMRGELERFPDGELCPVVGPMRGDDVYVFQPTAPPVNEHLMELALLVDACRRAGSERVTAVVPYFGYARQDRRSRPGQAIGARVAADILASAGADRIVVVDPHTPGFEATCSIPVEVLTATSVLVNALSDCELGRSVIVAPDLGAVKLAERFAAAARPAGRRGAQEPNIRHQCSRRGAGR